MACSKNIYPAGPQLSEKAKEIAATLGKPDFKASNGWLDKWKKCFNITQKSIVGESGDVNPETVLSWKERLPVIVSGYTRKISIILMKQAVLGEPYQIKGLVNGARNEV